MAAVCTHVITGLTANELESSENGNASSANGAPINGAHTDLINFEPQTGLYWVIISIYCKANGSATTPKLRPYFYDAKQSEILGLLGISPSEFWAAGDLIFRADSAGNAIPTADGDTEKYVLAPIYIGNYPTRFALEDCALNADLVIVIERVSIEQLPTY